MIRSILRLLGIHTSSYPNSRVYSDLSRAGLLDAGDLYRLLRPRTA